MRDHNTGVCDFALVFGDDYANVFIIRTAVSLDNDYLPLVLNKIMVSEIDLPHPLSS